jgi:septal ring factor EnvC (AmiA/AmiB activator)
MAQAVDLTAELDPRRGPWLVERVSRFWLRALGPIGLTAVVGLWLGSAGAGKDNSSGVSAAIAALKTSASASANVADPLARAEDALERASDVRRTGDTQHATLLEGLAREWVETAQTFNRAQRSESKASELERNTADLEAKVTRARTLLEETVARRGRVRAALDALTTNGDGGTPEARDGGGR